MNNFKLLHRADGSEVWVNLSLVTEMTSVGYGTEIHFASSGGLQSVAVKETPRDILS